MTKYAYIAIETKVRELDAKILLSCVLAERGYKVFLGHKTAMKNIASFMPSGIFLEKSAAVTKIDLFKDLKEKGHRTAVHDEEGLVLLDDDAYLKRRVSGKALAETDMFFTWGPHQQKIIGEKYPEIKERIVSTGHPRFDLLRSEFSGAYDKKAKELNDRYGRYILLNTKFGTCNNVLGKQAYFEQNKKNGLLKDEVEERRWQNYFDFWERLFEYFKEIIPALSKEFPQYTILIRPHPSENLVPWQEIAAHFQNVSVVREGPVYPWIKGAEMVLHNGCTTAIEAMFLNKPAVSYRPIKSEESDVPLPNQVSIEANDEKSLIAILKSILNEENRMNSNLQSYLVEYLSGMTGKLASERIADHFDAITTRARRKFPCRRLLSIYWENIRNALKPRNRVSSNNKFEGLEKEEVIQFCKILEEQDLKFKNIKVKNFGRNCVQITAG